MILAHHLLLSRASLSWLVTPGEHHVGSVLALLVLTAAAAPLTGRLGPVVLAVVSGYYLLVNGPMEGLPILSLTPNHGLTQGDLGGVAGILAAVVLEGRAWVVWSRARGIATEDRASWM